ncbi:hypothetical protein [Clostridium perfringens]|uniref:Uncharacterized protein n=1 Tax=Clostridium perfringens TaxID=1502 RepID=A0AAP4EE35_CLOPF|nr:hypothetical protein [Clostridium perfringens]MDH2335795.1 hypothetical protein [Clostridium perfringens]
MFERGSLICIDEKTYIQGISINQVFDLIDKKLIIKEDENIETLINRSELEKLCKNSLFKLREKNCIDIGDYIIFKVDQHTILSGIVYSKSCNGDINIIGDNSNSYFIFNLSRGNQELIKHIPNYNLKQIISYNLK